MDLTKARFVFVASYSKNICIWMTKSKGMHEPGACAKCKFASY